MTKNKWEMSKKKKKLLPGKCFHNNSPLCSSSFSVCSKAFSLSLFYCILFGWPPLPLPWQVPSAPSRCAPPGRSVPPGPRPPPRWRSSCSRTVSCGGSSEHSTGSWRRTCWSGISGANDRGSVIVIWTVSAKQRKCVKGGVTY